MPFYESIADYYDYIFPFNKAQISFIEGCVGEPYHSKSVLDIGCGTGDLAITLAGMGFRVIGIDADAEMLKKARSKETGSAAFTTMDMREISRAFARSSFDLVLCFGNTLVHLDMLPEIVSFCGQVKTVLKQGGAFLLQILSYDHILDHGIRSLPLITNNAVTFERYYTYDKEKNLIRFRTILTIRETGKKIENEIPLYPVRKDELDLALKKSGFTDVAYYGDFDKRELKEDSLPLVVSAR